MPGVPRNVEEDVRSEIGASEIGVSSPSGPVYYRVTIGGEVFDNALVADKYFECTFITRGMADHLRMRRAVYFFEIALFQQGLQRHKLLIQTFDQPQRVTPSASM